jgi:recombination protein U
MVQYPNGKKKTWVPKSTSASRRGMDLERDINITNQFYLDEDLAVIHKKPTPVTIVKVDYPARSAAKITEAYFKLPSTTDYNGIYKAKYLDFEAKECQSRTSFPLKSIHDHQIRHLEAVLRHGAIAFLLVRFTVYDITYLVPAEKAILFWNQRTRSSIPYKWFLESGYPVPQGYVKPVDYLQIVDNIYFSNKGGITSDEDQQSKQK